MRDFYRIGCAVGLAFVFGGAAAHAQGGGGARMLPLPELRRVLPLPELRRACRPAAMPQAVSRRLRVMLTSQRSRRPRR